LVVGMVLSTLTCAFHGGAACAAANAMPGEGHRVAAVRHDRCGQPGAHHDCCGGAHSDRRHGSLCCSTWASAPARPSLPVPPAVPLAFSAAGSWLEPDATVPRAQAPIPRASPPPRVSILRL